MPNDQLIDAFCQRLDEITRDDAQSLTWKAMLDASEDDLIEQGRRAADYAVAPFIWSRAVGHRWDTTELAEMLGITRQAVASRVKSGSLLALPGRGTRWYPSWQIDHHRQVVRPVVGELLKAWHAHEPDVDPLVIATWAMTPQDILDGDVPAELIDKGGSDTRVVAAAAATADRRTR